METLLHAAERKREVRDALVEKLRAIEADVSGEEQRCHDLEQIQGIWSLTLKTRKPP
jgi:hypothetical protein